MIQFSLIISVRADFYPRSHQYGGIQEIPVEKEIVFYKIFTMAFLGNITHAGGAIVDPSLNSIRAWWSSAGIMSFHKQLSNARNMVPDYRCLHTVLQIILFSFNLWNFPHL